MAGLVTCLWFNGEAEAAAKYYTSIFKDSKMADSTKYTESAKDINKEPGTVVTVEFELNGQRFVGLNGGPHFKFTPAISFQVMCKDQAEVDYYWEKLGEGGDESAQQCGWVADKYGMSWQVVPSILPKLLGAKDRVKADRAAKAMLAMKKLDIAELQKAFDG